MDSLIDLNREINDDEADSKEIARKLNIPVEWLEEDTYQPRKRKIRREDDEN